MPVWIYTLLPNGATQPLSVRSYSLPSSCIAADGQVIVDGHCGLLVKVERDLSVVDAYSRVDNAREDG